MHLEINVEECEQLSTLLDKALAEMHVEIRRTRNPQWQEALHKEEATLQGLREKLQVPV